MLAIFIIGIVSIAVAFIMFGVMVAFESMEDAQKRRKLELEPVYVVEYPLGNAWEWMVRVYSLLHMWVIVALLLTIGRDDDEGYWAMVIFAIIYYVVYVVQRILESCGYRGLRTPI